MLPSHQDHFAKFPARYALSVDARDIMVHMRLLEQAATTGRISVFAEVERGDSSKGASRSIIPITEVGTNSNPPLVYMGREVCLLV